MIEQDTVKLLREQHWEEYLSLLEAKKEASASNCLHADAEKK